MSIVGMEHVAIGAIGIGKPQTVMDMDMDMVMDMVMDMLWSWT